MGPLVHWPPILALLERRKVHFVFLSYSPMGVVAHKHLGQAWCQLPSSWSFCLVKHSSGWSFASACCSCSACFPRRLTGVQTLRLNAPLNVVPLFWEEPFLSSDPSFRVCQLCWASNRCLGPITSLAHLVDEWNRWSTIEESVCVQPVATALYWDRNYLKKASNFVTLVDCCSAYVDCVIAPVHLFFLV